MFTVAVLIRFHSYGLDGHRLRQCLDRLCGQSVSSHGCRKEFRIGKRCAGALHLGVKGSHGRLKVPKRRLVTTLVVRNDQVTAHGVHRAPSSMLLLIVGVSVTWDGEVLVDEICVQLWEKWERASSSYHGRGDSRKQIEVGRQARSVL